MAGEIIVLDEQKMLERINDLPNQLEKAWTSLWIKDLPIDPKGINRIIIAGMGGSGISGQLTKELFMDSPISIETWNDYGLPAWVNESTLFIAVSYSGETEETVDATKKALEKKAKILAISKGGKLEELAKINNFPLISVDYQSSPREAIGWLYGSLLTALTKLNLVPLKEEDYFKALSELKETVKKQIFPPKAEDLALSLSNKVPLILSYPPLTSVARRWLTQINENAKTFAFNANLPELCHNTLVGLDYAVPEKLTALFIESAYAFSRNTARRRIIEKVFSNKEIPFIPLTLRANSLLAEQWLFIYFGDLLSYYLAGVYGVDPSPIESIVYLKNELSKV